MVIRDNRPALPYLDQTAFPVKITRHSLLLSTRAIISVRAMFSMQQSQPAHDFLPYIAIASPSPMNRANHWCQSFVHSGQRP